ncbi:hypothetical protein TUM4438_13380 [Shewanella sairae]|uniref:Type I restriction modification DNA specificity domain-containing protein n=1 Tax=Shewanella sairae TaxID=190310 RepID=A0ABQ4P884_9GAMM|nr:restriction endonuclease subunit S [Shewanella sairae]MCL1130663.1 restriction endonuclease subunit S [Shewanella sairae]GIU43752.1 hypothetical protein TUM4438_13380 [Shewanella sairae]
MVTFNAIPEDWGFQPIGDYVEKMVGGAPLKPSDFSTSGVRVIPKKAVQFGGKIHFDIKTFCTSEFAESNKRNVVDNQFLITTLRDLVPSGPTIGVIGVLSEKGSFILAQGVYGLKTKNVDDGYLAQVSNTSWYRGEMRKVFVGSTQVHIRNQEFLDVKIPFPEQQKIAAILTSVDEVIEKTQAQIDKLKDLKTAMMQELLLPSEKSGVGTKQSAAALSNSERYIPHTEFKDSPVGRIPKSWGVVPLESLVKADKKITYGIVQAGPHCEGGVPYIRVSDMSSRHLTKKGMLLTSSDIAKKYERSAVCAGDIVYALRGMIGHVHIVPSELEGANLTQGTARISPSEAINTNYLLWAMRSPYVTLQNELEAKGSTFKEVTLASLRKMQIAVPSDSEQQFISATLSSIELKIFAVEDKLEQSKLLKKALMQDLLTGKVRVKLD